MDVYDRCVKKVPHEDKLEVYQIYAARAMDFFGVGKVRSIYEAAIEEELPDVVTKVGGRRRCKLTVYV